MALDPIIAVAAIGAIPAIFGAWTIYQNGKIHQLVNSRAKKQDDTILLLQTSLDTVSATNLALIAANEQLRDLIQSDPRKVASLPPPVAPLGTPATPGDPIGIIVAPPEKQ